MSFRLWVPRNGLGHDSDETHLDAPTVFVQHAEARRVLKAKADVQESWALVAGVIVVIGVFIEFAPRLWEPLRGQDWPLFWRAIKESTGGILVAVGVAAELAFGRRASSYDSEIHTSNEHDIRELLDELTWRKLTVDQMEIIRDLMPDCTGWELECRCLDTIETERYAYSLCEALNVKGMQILGCSKQHRDAPSFEGIEIHVGKEKDPTMALAIRDALSRANVEIHLKRDGQYSHTLLLVGFKPSKFVF